MRNVDEIIIRVLKGSATPKDEERVRRWREASAENEDRFRQLGELWSLLSVVEPVQRGKEPPEVDELLRKAGESVSALTLKPGDLDPASGSPVGRGREEATGEERARRVSRLSRLRSLRVGTLAACLVGLGLGLGLLMDWTPHPATPSPAEIVTGTGEMTTVAWGDRSTIRVGPNSRLRLSHESGETLAELDGRAFFAVAPTSGERFRVLTPRGEARVIGTRFEVRSERDGLRVLVVDGRVQMSVGGSDVEVGESELSLSVGGAPPTASVVEDVYEHLEWMGGVLVFQETPLHRAIREIESKYGVQVLLNEAQLAAVTVTMTFTNQPLEDVVLVLCETVGASCVIEGDRVRIGGGGPGSRTVPSTRTRVGSS